jgi:hypothetical protein
MQEATSRSGEVSKKTGAQGLDAQEPLRLARGSTRSRSAERGPSTEGDKSNNH